MSYALVVYIYNVLVYLKLTILVVDSLTIKEYANVPQNPKFSTHSSNEIWFSVVSPNL
jgi:hypothetical protein